MRADDILSQIDDTLDDWQVSGDAMRSRPADPDGEGWQALGTIDQVTISPEAVAEWESDWRDFVQYMARVQAERERRAREILDALTQVFQQVIGPAVQQAARDIEQAAEAIKAAGLCDDHGKPLPARDRPAWQSPYGPARRRR
ncbi:hypothetical protein [Streptomyces sp. NPDC003832]